MPLEEVLKDVWRWKWFSEDKGMDFNGWAVKLGKEVLIVDPAYAETDTWDAVAALGRPAMILLTNKDHERASAELKDLFKVPVSIHEADAPFLSFRADQTFKDGATLQEVFQVVRFRNLKSPGECAFFWKERKVLFVGDAVTGHPPGSLGLVKKNRGKPEVIEDLQTLLELDLETLLVGDGEPVLKDAKKLLKGFLDRSRLPAA